MPLLKHFRVKEFTFDVKTASVFRNVLVIDINVEVAYGKK
jgi:hypothetical protein